MTLSRFRCTIGPRPTTASRPPKFRRMRAALVALGCAVAVTTLSGNALGAWTTNSTQLDNGTCGRNLQYGSDKTASQSNTPSFYLMGDGGLSKYEIFVDGVS